MWNILSITITNTHSHTHKHTHPPDQEVESINHKPLCIDNFVRHFVWFFLRRYLTIPRKQMCNYDSGMLLIELAYSQIHKIKIQTLTHTHTHINLYLLIFSAAM